MRILPQLLSIMDSKQGGKQKIRPRLVRRNAVKNINYDASSSSGGSDDSPSLRTRSLDMPPYSSRTSFRIGGLDVGEIYQICSRIGLSGPDDFAISFDDWEAKKAKSSSDLVPRTRLYYEDEEEEQEEVEVPGSKGGVQEGEVQEEAPGDVLGRSVNVGMRQKVEVSTDEAGVEEEEGVGEARGSQAGDVLGLTGRFSGSVNVSIRQKDLVVAGEGEGAQKVEEVEKGYLGSSVDVVAGRTRGLNDVGVGGNGGGGIKGVRPPVLATPMSVRTFSGMEPRRSESDCGKEKERFRVIEDDRSSVKARLSSKGDQARGEVTTTPMISSFVRGSDSNKSVLRWGEEISTRSDEESEGSLKGGMVLNSALSTPVQVLDRNIDDLSERSSIRRNEDDILEGSRSLPSRCSFDKMGSTRKYSKGYNSLNEEKSSFSADSARRGGEEISMRSTKEASLVSEDTSSVGVGRKGVQPSRFSPSPPSVFSPPPAMAARIYDDKVSNWDLVKSFAPENDVSMGVSDEESREAIVERDAEEMDGRVRLGITDALSESCSFSTSNEDDDSSSMNTDPINISPIDRIRSNIGNWHKGILLGSGSFGTVYEGLSEEGVFFAVKEVSLLDQGSQGRQSILQLEQEIDLLSQFEHQNIVRYLGTDKDESKLYIFLELVTKGSLAQLYQRFHLQDSQVSAYTRQILHGLKYLHDRNVVHRDVKCANILVDANGSVKLADFGLAKATNKVNDVKSCKGTALWMAPEVVNNKRGYGLRADIWSLGCTVLEMLTRQLPYSHLESVQALFRIGRGEAPPVPDSLSRDAKDFIHKCLQVKPDNRPTAAQLLEHSFVKRPIHASSGSASPLHSNWRQ